MSNSFPYARLKNFLIFANWKRKFSFVFLWFTIYFFPFKFLCMSIAHFSEKYQPLFLQTFCLWHMLQVTLLVCHSPSHFMVFKKQPLSFRQDFVLPPSSSEKVLHLILYLLSISNLRENRNSPWPMLYTSSGQGLFLFTLSI